MNSNILIIYLITTTVMLIALGRLWLLRRKQVINLIMVIAPLSIFIMHFLHRLLGFNTPVEIIVLSIPVVGFCTIGVMFLWFWRDPERTPPQRDGVIISPADGEVIYIKKITRGEIPISLKKKRSMKLQEFAKTELLRDGGYLVGIGMNVLNVHVNRAPIAGKILKIERFKGKFLSLKKDEALVQNERVTTTIDNGSFKIGIVQIASRLVRRIVTYLDENNAVEIGQRIGMIKFGSQVDLIIPKLKSLRLCVKPGDEVQAGQSIIADVSS